MWSVLGLLAAARRSKNCCAVPLLQRSPPAWARLLSASTPARRKEVAADQVSQQFPGPLALYEHRIAAGEYRNDPKQARNRVFIFVLHAV